MELLTFVLGAMLGGTCVGLIYARLSMVAYDKGARDAFASLGLREYDDD